MNKRIVWPKPTDDLPHACELLRQAILCLDAWRQNSEWRHAALDIYDAFDGDPASSVLTGDRREKLLHVMLLPGKDIKPPIMNRFFLRVLGAVQDAESIPE